MEEMESKLASAIAENRLIIDYPHTVETVANVFLNLTKEERKEAGMPVLARNTDMFKRVNCDQEPVSFEISGENVDRYSDDDLWIVKLAVKTLGLARRNTLAVRKQTV